MIAWLITTRLRASQHRLIFSDACVFNSLISLPSTFLKIFFIFPKLGYPQSFSLFQSQTEVKTKEGIPLISSFAFFRWSVSLSCHNLQYSSFISLTLIFLTSPYIIVIMKECKRTGSTFIRKYWLI